MAQPVGLLLAAREPPADLRGLPELEVLGLRNGHARALLRSASRRSPAALSAAMGSSGSAVAVAGGTVVVAMLGFGIGRRPTAKRP
jgi:uncharacterized membrane protein YdfJ with MMPL/SSD domain